MSCPDSESSPHFGKGAVLAILVQQRWTHFRSECYDPFWVEHKATFIPRGSRIYQFYHATDHDCSGTLMVGSSYYPVVTKRHQFFTLVKPIITVIPQSTAAAAVIQCIRHFSKCHKSVLQSEVFLPSPEPQTSG